MAGKQVVVVVQPDGSVSIDAQNFAGVGCAKATEALELCLTGGDRSGVDDKKKPEFFGATNTAMNTIKR